jgi:hypothetical protein
MARTYRDIAMEEMLRTVEEAPWLDLGNIDLLCGDVAFGHLFCVFSYNSD